MGMKTVFLDRDGVINEYPGDRLYVTSLRKFRFLPGAKKAIALLAKKGYKLFVASNQAGVGRGIYAQSTLDKITVHMLEGIRQEGGEITQVYYCTHRKDAGCACRKPKPGLLKKASRRYGINLKNSYFIGDTIRDVLTARAAGAKAVLVLCGREKLSNEKNWEAQPDLVFKNLFEAARFLVEKNK
jgi:histidinol-phosphate phosphatase family protein